MSLIPTLQIEVEGTGISRPLSEQVNLLGSLLGQVIQEEAGAEMLELVETLRQLCKQAAQENRPELREQAFARIHSATNDAILWLLRAYTAFFHLVNQAEQQEIIRINRLRARQSTAEHPRPESIDEAVLMLKQQGRTLDEVLALLEKLDIQPTLTAHPTEARRRSILYKQQHIAHLLAQQRRCELTPEEEAALLVELRNEIALLLATAEVREERPTVHDEVEQGLYFVQSTIWEAVPRIYEDVRRALRRYYGADVDFRPFLRYRSWIGSDRDGNPYVTPEITRWTALTQRRLVLQRYLEELRQLRRRLSLSDRYVAPPEALRRSLARDAQEVELPPQVLRQFRHESFRLKISYMMGRLHNLLTALDRPESPPPAYNAEAFIEDLRLLQRCLETCGFAHIARHGQLTRLLVLAQTFGFHLLTLDVRQHSSVHEEAVAELLRLAGVADDYRALPESRRQELLAAELSNPRPLLPPAAPLSEHTRQVLDTFAVIRDLVALDPRSVGSYIVSMTHTVSDLLEPMLLAKEVGLWHYERDRARCPIDFVPLFETIDDLEAAAARLEAILTHPIYRMQVAARGGFQEIMLGYSDSTKDGGYWMANWALHQAQEQLAEVCRRHGVDFRLFHGRGGTVGRGGGRANQAILAMPAVVHNGRIRFTEQGEVISFRYALPEIAHRHLEQIVNAMLRACGLPTTPPDDDTDVAQRRQIMETLAIRSMQAYRQLIEAPGFWDWYTRITPIEQISRLPIASRPVSRRSAREVDFENLRAIPWVFAWTQVRYLIPGWFGIGQALHELLSASPPVAETLRTWYRSWPFFRTVLQNAQREMVRARLEIAAYYDRLLGDGPTPFHHQIEEDFQRARQAILRLTDQEELLDHDPIIRKSVMLRNPYTDVLNLLQVELMLRYRQAPESDREPLRRALFLSINGLAAAMQSTG
ncbi:phosphoenolpyruvate carboxylase [Rhodothermus bifroesti]|uniref:phosphoenolpyruvate carboxylase n=1 Tax=Rhodothermus bifroesti TaxID=2823335 RepID=UPI001AF0297A|nr:phosphoenolpyruvate carboxylase [Rhodothermus bifroesti]